MTTSGKQEVDAGSIDDFPPDEHRIVEVGGREVGIYNVEGTLYAVQNTCAHALAPICVAGLTGTNLPAAPGEFVYGMENRVLRCPWHGWEFDVTTGESLFGTDRRRLRTFPVEVRDGRVLVTMRVRRSSTASSPSSSQESDPAASDAVRASERAS